MKISIIIPAFNEEKLIASTVTSIRDSVTAFSGRGWSAELIVCDNNSTDRTAALAREAGAVVVFEPVNQIARARNTGAAAATGDWLVFIDADSRPSPGLFKEMSHAIASGKYIFGGSTLVMEGVTGLPKFVANSWNRISRMAVYAAGSFLFCETAAFRKIGGFDTNLYASEEINLSRRLKAFARRQGKKGIILHHNPLVTSGRKMQLYTTSEYLIFTLKAVFRTRRTLGSREECHIWYDGRR
jgi:glycosyltransferase involved in cell wall biosynthesis